MRRTCRLARMRCQEFSDSGAWCRNDTGKRRWFSRNANTPAVARVFGVDDASTSEPVDVEGSRQRRAFEVLRYSGTTVRGVDPDRYIEVLRTLDSVAGTAFL